MFTVHNEYISYFKETDNESSKLCSIKYSTTPPPRRLAKMKSGPVSSAPPWPRWQSRPNHGRPSGSFRLPHQPESRRWRVDKAELASDSSPAQVITSIGPLAIWTILLIKELTSSVGLQFCFIQCMRDTEGKILLFLFDTLIPIF